MKKKLTLNITLLITNAILLLSIILAVTLGWFSGRNPTINASFDVSRFAFTVDGQSADYSIPLENWVITPGNYASSGQLFPGVTLTHTFRLSSQTGAVPVSYTLTILGTEGSDDTKKTTIPEKFKLYYIFDSNENEIHYNLVTNSWYNTIPINTMASDTTKDIIFKIHWDYDDVENPGVNDTSDTALGISPQNFNFALNITGIQAPDAGFTNNTGTTTSGDTSGESSTGGEIVLPLD